MPRLPKLIGVLWWFKKFRYYRVYCTRCDKKKKAWGYTKANRKRWAIRQGDAGSFSMLCFRCGQEFNPDAEMQVTLFTNEEEGGLYFEMCKLPAPRTLERLFKKEQDDATVQLRSGIDQ